MKMKININNVDKITATIEAVESRSTARTIEDASQINACINDIENRLSTILPKTFWKGITARVDLNAQSFPNCYNGIPMSTIIRLERCSSGWFMTGIYRGETQTKEILFVVPTALDAKILSHVKNSING